MQTKAIEQIAPAAGPAPGPITAPPRHTALMTAPVQKKRPRSQPEVTHGA